jgi:hypothetical protein
MSTAELRPAPCISCPYRRDVPSGVWHESEYDKLPNYDGDTAYQSPAVFDCHQKDNTVCAGWLGHRDPFDLLAVRLGVSMGVLPEEALDYTTKVPLFATGEEAAEHGKREIENPGEAARKIIRKFDSGPRIG